METINFSFIADDDDQDKISAIRTLIAQYEKQTPGVSVRLSIFKWENAFSSILDNALRNGSFDISVIGSMWTRSLTNMKAIRPIKLRELTSIDLTTTFLGLDVKELWSIPWTSNFYVIVYWRDLVEEAGLDEKKMFASSAQLCEAAALLTEAGIEIPWLMPTTQGENTTDGFHIALNWLWEAGGEIIDATYRNALFTEPNAISGWCEYFNRYLCVPPQYRQIDYKQAQTLFFEKRAVAMMTQSQYALGLMNRYSELDLEHQIGYCLPSSVPWLGGENLIVWQNLTGGFSKEHAILNFINFLISENTQTQFSRLTSEFPAQVKTLECLIPAKSHFSEIAKIPMLYGRRSPDIPLWLRIEPHLALTLQHILHEINENPKSDLEVVIRHHFEPVARCLTLILEQLH